MEARMNIKGNKRYTSTHDDIVDSVIRLLDTKTLRQITVAEVCRINNINRSTFYEHFLDIPDVMEKTEREYAAALAESMAALISKSRREAFVAMFEYIKEHRAFYRKFTENGGTIQIPDELLPEPLRQRKREIEVEKWNDDSIAVKYHQDFFRGGINRMLRLWIERDCAESSEVIFELIKDEYGR